VSARRAATVRATDGKAVRVSQIDEPIEIVPDVAGDGRAAAPTAFTLPQFGIFAQGTHAHHFLEFDVD
jgi:hypothetical protein